MNFLFFFFFYLSLNLLMTFFYLFFDIKRKTFPSSSFPGQSTTISIIELLLTLAAALHPLMQPEQPVPLPFRNMKKGSNPVLRSYHRTRFQECAHKFAYNGVLDFFPSPLLKVARNSPLAETGATSLRA